MKLALGNTDNCDIKDLQKLISASENIDQLRLQHDHLIHDYITPTAIAGSAQSSFEPIRDEPFEHKGDYSEGKEEKEEKVKTHEASLPPAYEEDQPVDVHISGGEGLHNLD